jgi:hypothetical protein
MGSFLIVDHMFHQHSISIPSSLKVNQLVVFRKRNSTIPTTESQVLSASAKGPTVEVNCDSEEREIRKRGYGPANLEFQIGRPLQLGVSTIEDVKSPEKQSDLRYSDSDMV